MMDLSAVRDRWISERPKYQGALEITMKTLRAELYRAGMQGEVTGRIKEVGSLLKKLSRADRPRKYEEIGDKAGARVIILFDDQIVEVQRLIDQTFDHGSFDNKTSLLGSTKMGYQGLHVDIAMEYEQKRVNVEVQVRTLAQHVWSEVSHALAYKIVDTFPDEVLRRLNIGNAILEVFGHEIAEVKKVMNSSPELKSRRIIGVLEPLFLGVARSSFDRDLSVEIVDLLQPLVLDNDLEATRQLVEQNEPRLITIIDRVRGEASGSGILLTQPEGLLLLHLLEAKRNQLCDLWTKRYALEWLEDVADTWGIRLGTRD